MESPTIGNAPAARIPVESFNLGASSPTSTSSVGTQNQAYITGETAVDCQNSFMLLLTAVRRSFYAQRGKLCYKNLKRSLEKQEQMSTSDEGKQLLDVRRRNVKGTLNENIASLEMKIHSSKSHHLMSQLSTLAVAKHILKAHFKAWSISAYYGIVRYLQKGQRF